MTDRMTVKDAFELGQKDRVENMLRSARSFMRGMNSDGLAAVVKEFGDKFKADKALVAVAIKSPKLDKIYFVLGGGDRAKPDDVLSFLKDKGLIWKRTAASL